MNIDQETCSIIKKDCSKPIYMQVAEYLSDNINSGRWKDSERIPSEAELTESLGVSRGSVKRPSLNSSMRASSSKFKVKVHT